MHMQMAAEVSTKAGLMFYDFAQYANSLARVAIGFLSDCIEAITTLAEFLRSNS